MGAYDVVDAAVYCCRYAQWAAEPDGTQEDLSFIQARRSFRVPHSIPLLCSGSFCIPSYAGRQMSKHKTTSLKRHRSVVEVDGVLGNDARWTLYRSTCSCSTALLSEVSQMSQAVKELASASSQKFVWHTETGRAWKRSTKKNRRMVTTMIGRAQNPTYRDDDGFLCKRTEVRKLNNLMWC